MLNFRKFYWDIEAGEKDTSGESDSVDFRSVIMECRTPGLS